MEYYDSWSKYLFQDLNCMVYQEYLMEYFEEGLDEVCRPLVFEVYNMFNW